MILDKLLELSDKQAITTSAKSTNKIDFSQKHPNLGLNAVQMYAVATVNENFAGLTNLRISLEHSDTETGSFSAVSQSDVIPLASLKVGNQFIIPMPVTHKRYMQAAYTVTGTATSGKLSLHLTTGLQMNEPMQESSRVFGGKK